MIVTAYFWREGQLVEYFGKTAVRDVAKAGLADLYSVDLTTPLRLGMFGIYESGSSWKHVPLETFPPDFRTTLLLLGVT